MNDFSLGPLKRIFYTVFRTKNHNPNSFRPPEISPLPRFSVARHGADGVRAPTSDTDGT